MQNRYLYYLIDPNFQGINILFVLSFENTTDREIHTGYYLPKVEIKDYNVMLDGKKLLDQPTSCFLDYPYFKEYNKLIAIDLSKQQKLDAYPKAIQQINFTKSLSTAKGTAMIFIREVNVN